MSICDQHLPITWVTQGKLSETCCPIVNGEFEFKSAQTGAGPPGFRFTGTSDYYLHGSGHVTGDPSHTVTADVNPRTGEVVANVNLEGTPVTWDSLSDLFTDALAREIAEELMAMIDLDSIPFGRTKSASWNRPPRDFTGTLDLSGYEYELSQAEDALAERQDELDAGLADQADAQASYDAAVAAREALPEWSTVLAPYCASQKRQEKAQRSAATWYNRLSELLVPAEADRDLHAIAVAQAGLDAANAQIATEDALLSSIEAEMEELSTQMEEADDAVTSAKAELGFQIEQVAELQSEVDNAELEVEVRQTNLDNASTGADFVTFSLGFNTSRDAYRAERPLNVFIRKIKYRARGTVTPYKPDSGAYEIRWREVFLHFDHLRADLFPELQQFTGVWWDSPTPEFEGFSESITPNEGDTVIHSSDYLIDVPEASGDMRKPVGTLSSDVARWNSPQAQIQAKTFAASLPKRGFVEYRASNPPRIYQRETAGLEFSGVQEFVPYPLGGFGALQFNPFPEDVLIRSLQNRSTIAMEQTGSNKAVFDLSATDVTGRFKVAPSDSADATLAEFDSGGKRLSLALSNEITTSALQAKVQEITDQSFPAVNLGVGNYQFLFFGANLVAEKLLTQDETFYSESKVRFRLWGGFVASSFVALWGMTSPVYQITPITGITAAEIEFETLNFETGVITKETLEFPFPDAQIDPDISSTAQVYVSEWQELAVPSDNVRVTARLKKYWAHPLIFNFTPDIVAVCPGP
jgi:hypothetical protein